MYAATATASARKSPPRVLRRSEDRREEVLEAAQHEFARRGLYGTPTAGIARSAGISQAYLFRLYPTKEELFIACVQRCHAMVRDAFAEAGAPHRGDTDAALAAMAEQYQRLLTETDLLANQLHSYAACQEPAVREAVQESFGEIVDVVKRESGASDEQVQAFTAQGMLLSVIGALGGATLDEPWAKALTGEGNR